MSRKIVVGVDMRNLRIARTGARTYQEEICREFKKGHQDFSFRFIDTCLPVYAGNNKLLKVIEHIRFFAWKQISLPIICFFNGCDILFCTDYFLPVYKIRFKTVVVFHDAFFWEYPDHYNYWWLKLLNVVGLAAARKADAIVTVTNHSKKQIIQHTSLNPERIVAIHLAPKSSISLLPATVADKKFILHVGVLEKRKNLLNLIRAFHLLVQEGYHTYKLVLVGNTITKENIDDSANIYQLIDTLGLKDNVLLTGFVPDEELAYYYSNACVYAFVSSNEGFGLPVLEAFQNNLPALIADNSCLPEVGGDAVITCDPFNVNDIRDKLKMILENKALQAELIAKGQKRLASFSWKQTTSELLQTFKKIISVS